jgi:threonine aldolase
MRIQSATELPALNFASDNAAPVHPRVLDWVGRVNSGRVLAYGHDPYTAQVQAIFREKLGAPQADVHLLWSGTAANVLALKCLLRPHEAVVSTELAHLAADETGAPEAIVGCKVYTVSSSDAKLTQAGVVPWLAYKGDPHRAQPRVVSISNSTEYGTVYTPEEIRLLAAFCRQHNLLLHLDGARLGNACAHLNCTPRELITHTGVDVVSFGGTKAGLLGAEALIFLNPELAPHAVALQKQGMQLTSKMRYLAAQFLAYWEDDHWLQWCRHANTMAQRLFEGVRQVPGVRVTQPVQANAVFAVLNPAAIEWLRERAVFHVWDPHQHEVRWMCGWDTTPQDVDAFIALVRQATAT